jgi:hypothetical protein
MGQRIITHRGPNETLFPGGVASIAELKLLSTADVDDRVGVYVAQQAALYFYDYGSALVEHLPTIVEPAAGVGRWKRHGYTGATESVGVKSEVLDGNVDFTYETGTNLSTATLSSASADSSSLQGMKLLARNGVLNMRRTTTPSAVGEFSLLNDRLVVYGDITGRNDKYLVVYPIIVETEGLRVEQELLLSANFSYTSGPTNASGGISSILLSFESSADANLQGMKLLAKGGVLNMKRVSGAPAANGEYRMTGTTLEIYGDIRGSGDTYLAVYPVAQ